jgi:hypothetical protein
VGGPQAHEDLEKSLNINTKEQVSWITRETARSLMLGGDGFSGLSLAEKLLPEKMI